MIRTIGGQYSLVLTNVGLVAGEERVVADLAEALLGKYG